MVELLNKVIQRLNKEFMCTGPTVNMSLDAWIMKLAARLLYEATKRLQTDTKRFNVMEFAGKCVRALDPTDWATTATDGSGSRRRGGNDDNDDSIVRRTIGFDTSDWVEFGRKYCPNIQSIVPPMNYIFGAFESEPPAERPVKQRQKRQKTVLSEQTQATQLVTENMNDDGTPEEVELIMETIKKLESRNKNFDSLPYIQVVTNPKSMAETVENIFHSAFLVKDGLVRLRAADDGLPGVQSIDNSGLDVQSGLPEQGIQSVFTFTMKDWVKWCEKFEIKKPAIRHKKKDNNNNKKSQKTSDSNNNNNN
ncbi:non-structural maintenance of chromosomes element 4 homolog A-like [Oppia nitens]|uniref:non-structural maintenance of chromosomes element 4 homolog A-like n=1 Tax=Oppia nitens TaxID=1686743 RepID=UPI0023DB2783|nr:non-structural maintenance of chromosomes element 4 homolog A-like [Oppia nitens]